MIRVPRWRVLLLVGLALGPVAGAAEGPRGVELAVTDCPADWEASIRRIARVEIGDLILDPGRASPSPSDRVVMTCGQSRVDLDVTTAGIAAPLHRQLPLEGYPVDSRPRVIALAAIELVASVSPEVRRRIDTRRQAASPPTVVAAPALGSGLATKTTAQAGPTASLLAVGVYRRFLADRGVATWGGALRLEDGFRLPLGISVDLDVAGSRGTTAFGDVGGILASAGAHLDGRWRARSLQARAGLGWRLGIARLSGQPSGAADVSGQSFVRPWSGPMAAGEMVVGWGRLRLAVALEAGLTVWSARGTGNSSTLATVGGPWVAISLGAGTTALFQ